MSSHFMYVAPDTLVFDWLFGWALWGGRSFIMSGLITLSENPWNSIDIQADRKTCTMKRLYCVVFIIVLICHVCAATEKKPSKGKANH